MVVYKVFPFIVIYRLLCGIIARSAGLFQNTKKVCTCDGVTLWEEAAAQKNNQKKSPL